jgi:hypothetical protein
MVCHGYRYRVAWALLHKVDAGSVIAWTVSRRVCLSDSTSQDKPCFDEVHTGYCGHCQLSKTSIQGDSYTLEGHIYPGFDNLKCCNLRLCHLRVAHWQGAALYLLGVIVALALTPNNPSTLPRHEQM